MVTFRRMLHDQRVDVFLTHGLAETFLACVNDDGLAARQFEDLARDQAVMDHHISLIEGIARLERQQLRITGACANKINRSGLCRLHDMCVEKGLECRNDSRLAVTGQRLGAGAKIERRPEFTAPGAHGQHFCCVAECLADTCEDAKRCRQLRLQIGLDGPGKDRGGAFGPDRNGYRVTVHDGRGDELAVIKIVDNIDQCALSIGNRRDARVLGIIFVSSVKQRGSLRITRLHGARDDLQLALIGPFANVIGDLSSDHGQPRLCFHQQAQLGQSGVTTARKDNAAALNSEEYGKMLHGEPLFLGFNIE